MRKINVRQNIIDISSTTPSDFKFIKELSCSDLLHVIDGAATIVACLNWSSIDSGNNDEYKSVVEDMCTNGFLAEEAAYLKNFVEDKDECEKHIVLIEKMNGENLNDKNRVKVVDYFLTMKICAKAEVYKMLDCECDDEQ